MQVSEQELLKLISAAATASTKAAGGDAAEDTRAVDALKLLASHVVSSDLLMKTDAGKKVKKISKTIGASEAIRAAANACIDAWKDCVRQEQSKKTIAGEQKKAEDEKAGGRVGPTPKTVGLEDSKVASVSMSSQQSMDFSSIPTPKAGGGGKLKGQPARCNDATRNKIRDLLAEALVMAVTDETPEECDPCKVAVEVEVAIFKHAGESVNPKYKAKYRSLSFNLKDESNPDLRSRVLTGEIDADILVNLSAEELASNERRQENNKIRDQMKAECQRGQKRMASTDMFQCGKCKQRKCTYYQMQTRSADEPMTTFVTCTNCDNRWKFC